MLHIETQAAEAPMGKRTPWTVCLCFVAFLLSSATPLAQPAPARESLQKRGAEAVHELGRDLDPYAQRRARDNTRRALGVWDPGGKTGAEAVADAVKAVDSELRRDGLRLKVLSPSPQPRVGVVKLEPMPSAIEHSQDAWAHLTTVFQSIVRREDIIESLDGRVLVELEGRISQPGAKSELEIFLQRDLKLKDHAAVAMSFDSNVKVKWMRLPQPVTLLRLFGGESAPLGRWLFCCREPHGGTRPSVAFVGPFSAWTDARGLAVPVENSLHDLALVELPADTNVLIGTVANNFVDKAGQYRLGGNTQIFVPTVKDFPYERYRLAESARDPKDIVVVMDNGRIGRFRP